MKKSVDRQAVYERSGLTGKYLDYVEQKLHDMRPSSGWRMSVEYAVHLNVKKMLEKFEQCVGSDELIHIELNDGSFVQGVYTVRDENGVQQHVPFDWHDDYREGFYHIEAGLQAWVEAGVVSQRLFGHALNRALQERAANVPSRYNFLNWVSARIHAGEGFDRDLSFEQVMARANEELFELRDGLMEDGSDRRCNVSLFSPYHRPYLSLYITSTVDDAANDEVLSHIAMTGDAYKNSSMGDLTALPDFWVHQVMRAPLEPLSAEHEQVLRQRY